MIDTTMITPLTASGLEDEHPAAISLGDFEVTVELF
jgi:hypothetical protein